MRNIFLFIWEIIKIVIIALLIVIPIRYYIFQPFIVKGQSMEPNFQNGDYLIIDQITYRFRSPQRGEVVVLRYPDNSSQRFIKRIIGLPGEKIAIGDGKVIIYDSEGTPRLLDESDYLPANITTPGNVKLVLGESEYFVLGDNRLFSSDSRRWGPLSQKNIVGRVFLRLWPPNALAKFEPPQY